MTHAFFKALLFLAAGSVIHAMGGEQDMTRMGGLSKKIRWTYLTMLTATLAIAGFPPLAGFSAKIPSCSTPIKASTAAASFTPSACSPRCSLPSTCSG